jgi:16S rRNA (guanine966-N2)-methyltransferase
VRIISGEFRGRNLTPPAGQSTRPMLDRVREALFSTLGDCVRGARVLDLFSGTGSLGLEALSRGAVSTHFVEKDRKALSALRRNVTDFGVEDRTDVRQGDALNAKCWADAPLDVAFLDPPYAMVGGGRERRLVFEAVERLVGEYLAPGGVLMLHAHPHSANESDFPGGHGFDCRVYNNSALFYLWKSSEVEA